MFFWGRAGISILALPLFLSGCSSLFYYPDRSLYYLPQQIGLTAHEIAFRSADETLLYGWHLPSKKIPSRGMVVQFHGNAENMSSHYLQLAWLTERGYDLFVFDYRGYGKSQDEPPSPRGTVLDGVAALDQAWELKPRSGKFVVIGQSLGGAIAMRSLADFKHRNDVALVVLDSTFSSYQDVARKKLAGFWLTWPLSPLSYVLVSDEFASTDEISKSKTPLLVVHDQKDPAVPYECGEALFAASPAKKEFWRLDEGDHIAAFSEKHPENRERLIKLIEAQK